MALERTLKRVAKSLQRMDIDFDVMQRDDGTPFITVPYDVVTGDRIEPVDVNIDSQSDRVLGDRHLSVTSFVMKGQKGKNEVVFSRALDHLNYESRGKFVPDVHDGSRDILLTETMPEKARPPVIRKTLQHVAGSVARVRPDLEGVSRELDLQPVLQPSEEDKFAAQWFSTRQSIRALRPPGSISFLQPSKEHKKE